MGIKEAERIKKRELAALRKNPAKYAGKCVKEAGKFAANPARYTGTVVVKFGARTAVNAAYTIAREEKEKLVDDTYRQEHPIASVAIDAAFAKVESTQKGARGQAQKAGVRLVQGGRAEFKKMVKEGKQAINAQTAPARAAMNNVRSAAAAGAADVRNAAAAAGANAKNEIQ